MNRLMSVMVAAAAIVALSVPVAAAEAPITVRFEKAPAGADYFAGAVEGGGTIEMWIDDGGVRGNTQHFSAIVQLTGTSAGTLTAEVSGQMNLGTGRAVLNGVVTDGAYEGARVHEESQLVNPETFTFTGIVRIMPAS